ncbi:MAG: acyl-CoA dehydrogenase family protein, partial [Chloroflexota bacterium]|nr:acyl-CoA dehydrogenase family protein [Chloroflexota bacterium]
AGWRINGSKMFITSARYAPLFIVLARVGQPEKDRPHAGITAFVVPAGTAGLVIGPGEHKMGLRASDTSGISLEDARIDGDAVLGEVGKGFGLALAGLDGGRIGIAAQSIGIARGAMARAIEYGRGREQFGRSILTFEAIQFALAQAQTELDAARLLTHRAARLRDCGQPFTREASMAKLYASEAAQRATYSAVQIFGGYGYMSEYSVERYERDARATTLYEGTSEVQRMVIARSLLAA